MQERLRSYLAALNNHDIEEALTHLSEDFRLIFVGSDMSMTKEQVVDVLGWDAGANGSVTYENLQVGSNTISGIFTEENDFLKLVEITRLKASITYTFDESGLIVEQLYDPLPNQPSFQEKMKPAIAWASKHRGQELAIIYPNNRMIFNEDMARRWVALLRAWRNAIGSEDNPLD